jgi:leucyl aminopeptidase
MIHTKHTKKNKETHKPYTTNITSELFLQRFVESAASWLHVDIYGWTPSAKPGRPEGGECQAARALFALLSQRYG